MKRSCSFQMNPAFLWASPCCGSAFSSATCWRWTAPWPAPPISCPARPGGLLLIGLLYGAPKTRPLFDKFHAFKRRLIGRE